MKICQIVPSLEMRHGGPSRSSYELSAALARSGNDVELLTTDPRPGNSIRDGRLEIQVFRRDWPQLLCCSSGLRNRARTLEADVVHHHSIWLRTLHYARGAADRCGVPLVVSPRGMMSRWAWRRRNWRKRLARGLIHPGALAQVRGWHATSTEEAAEIRARGFTQPICIAPNGVSAPAREREIEAVRHWQEACPRIGSHPVALFYSRFHPKKRLLELIDLWLETAPADWILLIVGIPEDYTPEMLEDYIHRSLGGGRIFVFSGAGRPAPYFVASLFLLPSHNENFGLAIAEALAHGVPVLVTDTTPWSGLNANGGGWCVPWAGYAASLRAALAEGPERLRSRGEIGRSWVLREFSWDKSARMLADFYAQLAAK